MELSKFSAENSFSLGQKLITEAMKDPDILENTEQYLSSDFIDDSCFE